MLSPANLFLSVKFTDPERDPKRVKENTFFPTIVFQKVEKSDFLWGPTGTKLPPV